MAPFKKTGGFRGNGPREGSFGGNRGGFDRGGSDRPHFAKKAFGGSQGRDRDDRPLQMFQATCADCGKSCEVPFRPTGERPVFCKECFGDKRGSTGGDYGRGPAPERTFPKREFAPAYAPKPSFEHKPAAAAVDPRIGELMRSVEAINKKLDTLSSVVEHMSRPVAAPVKVVVAEKKAPVVIDKKAPVVAKKAPAPLSKVVGTVAKKVTKAKAKAKAKK